MEMMPIQTVAHSDLSDKGRLKWASIFSPTVSFTKPALLDINQVQCLSHSFSPKAGWLLPVQLTSKGITVQVDVLSVSCVDPILGCVRGMLCFTHVQQGIGISAQTLQFSTTTVQDRSSTATACSATLDLK